MAHSDPPTPIPSRASAPSAGDRLAKWLIYALVLATVTIVHWPVLFAQAIVFDDEMYLFNNRVLMVPSWSNAGLVLREVLHSSTVEGYYEPLTLHSLMLDVVQGGRWDHLGPFHRTSLLLHLANTLLLMLLLESLSCRPIVAAVVGLIFAVHPLTVEPVAWVWERKTVLATMFVLLVLVCYVRYVRTQRRGFYLAALLLLLLALMSKPTVTPLPVMLVLLDFWPLRRTWNRRTLLEKAPFFALALTFGLITVISTASSGVVQWMDRPHTVLRLIYLVGFYAGKIVWPVPLSCAYALPEPMSLMNPTVALPVLFAVTLGIAALLAWRRWGGAGLVPGAWFLAGLLPTMGVVSYSWIVASDKYVYFPIIGLMIGLALGLSAVGERVARRIGQPAAWRIGVACALIPIALEIVQTRAYLAQWRDTITLSRHMLAVGRPSPSVYTLLGGAYSRANRLNEAAAAFESALALDPSDAAAHILYAEVLARQGRVDAAASHLERAEIRGTLSNLTAGHRVMARLRRRQGRDAEAVQYLQAAVAMQPLLCAGRLELAQALLASGQPDQAAQQFDAVLHLKSDPDERCEALFQLGLIALGQHRVQEAANAWLAVLAIDRFDPRANFQLGTLAQGRGDASAAIAYYRAALVFNPGSSARNNLAWILATCAQAELRSGKEAVALAEPVPGHSGQAGPESMDTLAAAYAEAGNFTKAVATAESGLALAKEKGNTRLAGEIESRLALYRQKKPYRESSPEAAN